MGKMIEGVWTTDAEQGGGSLLKDTVFQGRLSLNGEHPAEANRYHLYISYACPWAARVFIAHTLFRMRDVVGVSIVHPSIVDDGWHFGQGVTGATGDQVHGAPYLRDVYRRADAAFTGRVTVPVLWDLKKDTIVSNESRDLLQMFDEVLAPALGREMTLYPSSHMPEVDEMIDRNYIPVNKGVYTCGFAQEQDEYDEAVTGLFERLEALDAMLATQRYLCGDVFTAADVCLFPTLVRFDSVYSTHFKCNIKQLREFEHLWAYTREIYQMPGIASTVNQEHIKRHYYESHNAINPQRVVAAGPSLDFDAPHGRERLSGRFAKR